MPAMDCAHKRMTAAHIGKDRHDASTTRTRDKACQFHWVHAMAVDRQGNAYTAEVDAGKRIQKFRLTSDALR
ncbi:MULTISPECIES: hypothetical protein [unclassified Bradyrhizobium]|uniref:hypothetical protein n=1 Tax=unclassified Bradyrhizobium TaxID=2631580 RepID=UPI0028E955E2|nr:MULTISPECIES: hypothetical protein [unclassified Bradyrhizobium]